MDRDADLINWCDALAASGQLAGTIKDALRLYQHLAMLPPLRDLARSRLLCEAVRLGFVEISTRAKHTEQRPPEVDLLPAPASGPEQTPDWDDALRDALGIS